MMFLIGCLVVWGCVLGGYAAMGANLAVLWQPLEVVIIGGAAAGAFIIANPKPVISGMGHGFKALMKGAPYTKDDYLDLLGVQYSIFKLAKSKGMLALEAHIENPDSSDLFSKFPKFKGNHHAVEFVCDYLRLITMGSEDPNQMEDLMNDELDTHHHEHEAVASAMTNVGDGMPALGIVAAVLGVTKTMGAISQPPEILGKYIGGALVGTFLGVFFAYGFLGPMGNMMKAVFEMEGKYFECIKVGILAHMKGFAPAISVEYARKTLSSDVRPTFAEVEEYVSNL